MVLSRAVLVALLLSFAGPASAAELEIATLAPEGSRWMVLLREAGAKLAKRTQGRVTVKYFPGAQMGDERDVVRRIRNGDIDGAALTGTGLSLIDESIRLLELPMLFRDTAELDCVREAIWAHFVGRFSDKGFRLGQASDVGFIYFYSKKPVRALTDLKSSRVWMWTDDRIVRAIYKRLGIAGVPLGAPDVKTALDSGRIDAVYGSPLSMVAMQWSEPIDYVTSMPMTYAIAAIVVSERSLGALSAEDRTAVHQTFDAVGIKIRKSVRSDNARAQAALARTGGVKTVATPSTLVADFERASREVWNQLADDGVYSRDQLDMVLRYREQCRK